MNITHWVQVSYTSAFKYIYESKALSLQ